MLNITQLMPMKPQINIYYAFMTKHFLKYFDIPRLYGLSSNYLNGKIFPMFLLKKICIEVDLCGSNWCYSTINCNLFTIIFLA